MSKKTSPHILNTSANLLGFCLFVITSLQINNKAETSSIDELTSVIAVFLVFSCLMSFFSIKTKKTEIGKKLEMVADYLFALALIGILIIVTLTALHFIV